MREMQKQKKKLPDIYVFYFTNGEVVSIFFHICLIGKTLT